MKFAICNEIFQGWKLEDTLSYAARLGYAAVEIAPFTLANAVTDISALQRQGIRQSAARCGIEIAGIHWVLVKPEGLYINHPDEALRKRTAQYFCDLVDFCADLGGKVMVVGSSRLVSRTAPHDEQKFAPSGLRCPHWLQNTSAIKKPPSPRHQPSMSCR